MSLPYLLVNGEPSDSISVLDRGLSYGDGLFETILFKDGDLSLWQWHRKRLELGCRRLRLNCPIDDLERDLEKLAAKAAQLDAPAVIKIILTRGVGGRGYKPPEKANTTRICSINPLPSYPQTHRERGVKLQLCQTRVSRNKATAGIKHLNRLEQVLARSELDDSIVAEGLMLDETGHVIEGTMSNVFMVHQGVLYTPTLDHSGVAGVVRAFIVERIAQDLGLECREQPIDLPFLAEADEVFITNSIIGIWPVCELTLVPEFIDVLGSSLVWPKGTVTTKIQQQLFKHW